MKVIDDMSFGAPMASPGFKEWLIFFVLKYRCGSFDNSIKSYIYLSGNKQVSHVFSHMQFILHGFGLRIRKYLSDIFKR